MIVFVAIAAAVALLTWLLGWWGVAVAALAAGALLARRRGASWLVALAAIVAWGALIAANVIGGRFAALVAAVSGLMRVPPAVLVVVTLLFGALLAWSGAALGTELARLARHDPPSS